MSDGNSMALHFLMLPNSLMKSTLREKEILVICSICISILRTVLSSPCVWHLVAAPYSASKIMFSSTLFIFPLSIFCLFECFILNIVLSRGCLLCIFLPEYLADTLNVMFGQISHSLLKNNFSSCSFLFFCAWYHHFYSWVLHWEFQCHQWFKFLVYLFQFNWKWAFLLKFTFSFLFLLTLFFFFFFHCNNLLAGLTSVFFCWLSVT